jgi:hypothetical protein
MYNEGMKEKWKDGGSLERTGVDVLCSRRSCAEGQYGNPGKDHARPIHAQTKPRGL